jgi:hypothetical protein
VAAHRRVRINREWRKQKGREMCGWGRCERKMKNTEEKKRIKDAEMKEEKCENKIIRK